MTTSTSIVAMIASLCIFASAAHSAAGREVTVAIHVSAQGLNLSDAADTRKFYQRIKNAAWVACTRGDQVKLAPVDNAQECADRSLARAIGSLALPALTRIFLETHTLQQAVAMGIDVQMVAAATK